MGGGPLVFEHVSFYSFFHFYFKYWGCLETLTISIAEFLSQVWSGFGYSDFSLLTFLEKKSYKISSI